MNKLIEKDAPSSADTRSCEPDDILVECWRIKDELSAKYADDLEGFFKHMREMDEQFKREGWKFVSFADEDPKAPQ